MPALAYCLAGLFAPISAYIDPATGNFILQVLLGGIAAIWVMLKIYGKRIMQFFGIGKKKEQSKEASSSD